MSDSQKSNLHEDRSLTENQSLFTEDEVKDAVNDENYHENETAEYRRSSQIVSPALTQGLPYDSRWINNSYYDRNDPLAAKRRSDLHHLVPFDVDGTSPSGVDFETGLDQNETVEGDANTSTSEQCQPASTTDGSAVVNEDGHQKRGSRKTPLGSRSVEEADPSFLTGGGERNDVPFARRSKRAKGASITETEDEETSAPPPKLYKYQLDTPDAKAAKASKNTRDKKKAELEKAKATIKELEGTVADLKNKLEDSEKAKEEYRQQIESGLLFNLEGPQLRQTTSEIFRLVIQSLTLLGTPVTLLTTTTTFEHPAASTNGASGNEPN